ncbi:ScbR family autoregulator-binding transcription factor [Gordonia soli]|uniref:Putative TetR family transcriptional regulator n=1 Tax=Gordonia soli NBRC 108243 TaxID=1223545 RepID=M0QJ50_9ACTN|nr:ScbR family autoregulator-binding transcription factor [Gordonia soli]GAC67442.1 putative TetR family transcriptional regulator [Gordonia soli NBRC 108243]
MGAAPRQLHQARAVDTRRKLLAAAAAVFDDKGYAATTTADIVAEAEATKGALYFHFSTKEQIAQAIIQEQASWLDSLPVDEEHPVQAVINISYWVSSALRTDVIMRASIRLTIERNTFSTPDQDAYQQWEQALEQRWERASDEGLLAASWTPHAAAALVAGSFTGLQLVSQVASEDRRDLPARLTDFWNAVLPSLVSARGRKNLVVPPSPEWVSETVPLRPNA